jgi:thiol-disulfide isomerase/thioredoxin
LNCSESFDAEYLNIELKTILTKEVKLKNYKGKMIVLDFWASWCEPCKKAVPILEQIRKKTNPEKTIFLGVNTDTSLDLEEVRKVNKEFGIQYDSVLDPELKLAKSLEVEGQPALFILDKSGKLIFKQYGLNLEDLNGIVKNIQDWEK